MGLVFRPTTRAGALMTRSAATKLAAAVKFGQVKNQVSDGFILRAIGGDQNTIVQVLDIQVVIA